MGFIVAVAVLYVYRLRCNSYVWKLVDFIPFVRAVKQLAIYRLVTNEPPTAARIP